MSVWMATGYPQQAARVEAGEKQSGQPRLCTYVMREQGVAINHQKRGIQAESIAVNVFPDGANIVRFSSQIFPCDYGFHKKFQVFFPAEVGIKVGSFQQIATVIFEIIKTF